jgi:ubiquinone/menaquinone biosynthesis C-methylase UbiE
MTRPPEDVLREWRESAPFWEKHSDAIRRMFAPITRALIEEAQIREGDRVLDIAGGMGEPSLTIAETVGPHGAVVCTDVEAGMVAAAQREAEKRGAKNITFQQSPAESLAFEADSFDVVVSRLGAMFFTGVDAAISEMLRVTKPKGHISFAVWHDRDLNPFFHAVTGVMSRYVEYPPEDPDSPGGFRFSDHGKLAAILERCGASNVKERLFAFHIEAPLSLEEFWTIRSEMSDSLRMKLSVLSESKVQQIINDVKDAVQIFFQEGHMKIPAQVLIVTGSKS